ncbi:MAG: S46 family peptidase [Chitinophagales bacterium]|nr:S46 family peptidase [Chitinophagales bacterium]MDW8428063.1 S46 family peptidase [Chitinophagales bacterium]
MRYPCRLLVFLNLLIPLWAEGQGMWMPWQMPDAVLADLKQKGLTLSAEELFSPEKPSVKDAIVLFGGGCTGEFVSSQGLLFTNHHCARGVLQQLSTLERDLLKEGFWAKNLQEELPCPGLTVMLVKQVEEITDVVLQVIKDVANEGKRQRLVDSISQVLISQATPGNGYKAFVRPFYQGNQYFLFVAEEFRDVRLVGAPPQSIGNFGGDTDNWMWPRHTGDFAVFRVYADKNNQPAAYAPDNQPYRPRYWLPISLRGVEPGSLTLVYGFPGRTSQYLPSYGVQLVQEVSNPVRIALRGQRLNIWWQRMTQNDTVWLKYVAKYYGLSNTYKKWQGEQYGLQRVDVIALKRDQEAAFQQRAAQQANGRWLSLLEELRLSYDSLRLHQFSVDCWNEAMMAPELWRIAAIVQPLVDSSRAGAPSATIHSLRDKVRGQLADFLRNYDAQTDLQVMAAMLRLYQEKVYVLPPFLQKLLQKQRNRYDAFASWLFRRSVLDDPDLLKRLDEWNAKSVRKIFADPAYQLARHLSDHFSTVINPNYKRWNEQVVRLNRSYMQALRELFPERIFFPDANLTLRLSYGQVAGYEPRDGVQYHHYTTLAGVLEKYKPGDEEFDVPQHLLELAHSGNWGIYGNSKGELQTCFIASNHTTGGNSGSPVLNKNGELIGINFDRCWEGTMSDIYFDPSFCRNIAVDIRYVLFLIDRFGGAGYLLQELDLRR